MKVGVISIMLTVEVVWLSGSLPIYDCSGEISTFFTYLVVPKNISFDGGASVT